jgi:glycine/D-amino acid oxidase-like deaminating enzyme/nitrite reductase/ring-hydroxylating ferredoxin subunit
MNVADERSKSIWMDTDVASGAPSLDDKVRADTVIIGSGIAGLSTAYELAAAGQSVIVLDRGAIGSGMTARTTAHLAPICDDSLDGSITMRGEALARGFYESQAAGVDRIEQIQRDEGIACEFRRVDGYLFPGPGTEESFLSKEVDAARVLGVPVERVTGVPFRGQQNVPALRYPRQATFHPLQYLRGLAEAITARKGRLFAQTCVTEVAEASAGVLVKTAAGYDVSADAAVVATNSPINDRLAIHTKQAPYRTYAMALTIPRNELPDALYWDTLDPYHYVRLTPGRGSHDYLIVGGADHKTGEADDAEVRFEALEAWIRNLVPELGEVTHRWSGQVMETIDYCGFIGRNPGSERIYVATGDSGQGMTHGAASAPINSALILGRDCPWIDVYDPSRTNVRGIQDFVSENLTAVKNFAEYLAPGEITSVDELKAGEGAIVRDGLTKIAAYRDDLGYLHQVSAKCTHVGCHVHWNSFERCWDCPCHGSHFATDGTALNGPAISPLSPIAG